MYAKANTQTEDSLEVTRRRVTTCQACRWPMTVRSAAHSPITENVIVVLQCDQCGAWTTVVD